MEPRKSCDTCEHADEHMNSSQCCHCWGASLWVPLKTPQDAPKIDLVNHPSHYTSLPLEAIKTIRLVLTEVFGEEGFEAYCFGNELKYRLRAGFKGDPAEDIGKALKYAEFRKGNSG